MAHLNVAHSRHIAASTSYSGTEYHSLRHGAISRPRCDGASSSRCGPEPFAAQQRCVLRPAAGRHRRRLLAAAGDNTPPPLASMAPSDETALPGPRNAFVPGQEAQSRQVLFNNISSVYDELNDRLSLGQHRVWKRMTVKWSGAKPGHSALDVCCGSGDLAFELARAVGPSGQVVGLDFAAAMLQDAAARQRSLGPFPSRVPITWTQGDALQLPFSDASFDAATMGYGLRNVADIPAALSELARVLRPGCSAAVLDFNNSSDAVIDAAQGWLLENVVVPTAKRYGLGDEYAYLRPSIKRFPDGKEQVALAKRAGFRSAVHYEIGFGLMGVLVATK